MNKINSQKDAVKIMDKRQGVEEYGDIPITNRPLMRIALKNFLTPDVKEEIESRNMEIVKIDGKIIWVAIGRYE